MRRRSAPRLIEREAGVLRVLEQLQEGTAEAVATEAKLPVDEVRSALDRLVTLEYALRQAEGQEPRYRMAARSLKR